MPRIGGARTRVSWARDPYRPSYHASAGKRGHVFDVFAEKPRFLNEIEIVVNAGSALRVGQKTWHQVANFTAYRVETDN
jgi:hypothetical protein